MDVKELLGKTMEDVNFVVPLGVKVITFRARVIPQTYNLVSVILDNDGKIIDAHMGLIERQQ